MEDKRLREKIHSQDLEKLRFTKEDREDVFQRIRQPEKKRSRPKAFVPAAVSVLMIGICLFLFLPQLLAGNNEPDPSVASDPDTTDKGFATALITLKSEGMDDRSYVNLLLAYSEEDKQLNFISVPNGARMPVTETDDGESVYDKLLFSYSSGGAEALQAHVSEWAGMPIDQHAVIDLETLSTFVESTGGVEYNLENGIRVRAISTAAAEFGEGTHRLDGEELAALMMAATEGIDLDEENLLHLLDGVIDLIKNEATPAQLAEWFAEIEGDISPDNFIEKLSEIETLNMIPLSEGMIPEVGELNGAEGQHFITYEEEFLQSALSQWTEFDPEGDGCEMGTIRNVFYASTITLLLAGCGSETEHEEVPETVEEKTAVTENDQEENVSAEVEQEDNAAAEETETEDTENTNAGTEGSALSSYSSEQIEYARVWLQLGANQEIDGLYATKIPAGTPLNPDDETSGVYPEDVIQLAGSRLVDGSVTYSGNGDGTINVYNVPLRWDGVYPAGEEFYQDLINNTKLVPVDVGADEDVVRLIELLAQ